MVQISRSRPSSSGLRRHYCGTSRAFRHGLLGLLRFLVMSALIPSLFVIRYYWFSDSESVVVTIQNNILSTRTFAESKTGSGGGGSLRSNGQQQQEEQQQEEQQQAKNKAAVDNKERQEMFAFLKEIDFSSSSSSSSSYNAAAKHLVVQESDIVELDHCRIHDMNLENFTTWAFPLVNDTVTQLLLLYQKEVREDQSPIATPEGDDGTNNNNAAATTTVPVWPYGKMTLAQQDELRTAMQQEFVLELLEMYAHHAGYCHFSNNVYHPTVPINDKDGFTQRAVARLRSVEKQYASTSSAMRKSSPSAGGNNMRRVALDTDDDNVDANEQHQLRLVITIMAFKDVDQLRRLVQAVHMPQHYIIVHVEQRASVQFVQAIQQEILNDDTFDNVVLLKFGTIVYQTDSVSLTNLRIMRWITLDLQLDYDYYVSLDGSSFPLQHAHDLHFGLLQLATRVRSLTTLNDVENINNDAQGYIYEGVRFLDQESPSANNDGKAIMGDDVTWNVDSPQQAQHDMATTDFTNDDIGIENHPATVEGGSSVWLGALLHKGVTVDSPQWHYLLKKRLVFTRNMLVDQDASSSSTTAASAALSYPKLHKRLPRSVSAALASSSPNVPSEIIRSHMTKKSISGNQGIFRRNVVQLLLTSPDVMELFALSKYACCCCVEERNWIAALGIIGNRVDSGSAEQHGRRPPEAIDYQQEALRQSSTFELWGGERNTCVSSMKNAVLTRNASICYKIDDERLVQAATGSAKTANTTTSPPIQHYFFGNATWSYLKLAKSQGYFFARKFDSSQPQSMDLLNDIQSELWEQG